MLVVDQLEELFTLPGISVEDAHRSIRLLAGLARSGAVWVVATLRADFWHRAADMPDMMALAQGRRLDIAAPTPAELADMIRKPGKPRGCSSRATPQTESDWMPSWPSGRRRAGRVAAAVIHARRTVSSRCHRASRARLDLCHL